MGIHDKSQDSKEQLVLNSYVKFVTKHQLE